MHFFKLQSKTPRTHSRDVENFEYQDLQEDQSLIDRGTERFLYRMLLESEHFPFSPSLRQGAPFRQIET